MSIGNQNNDPVALDIAKGMEVLHKGVKIGDTDFQIIHRDLAARNVGTDNIK